MSDKGERHLDTPTVTRSYRSSNKMRLEEILDVHTMMEILDPSDEEFKVILMAAATIDAISRRSGAYGDPPFPAPIDFVEELFDHAGEDHPVWKDMDERTRSTTMLRCISKLSDYISKRLPEEADRELSLTCPRCGSDSVDVIIGNKADFDGKQVAFDEGQRGILDIKILCGCEPFTIGDVNKFEDDINAWIYSQ